MTFGSRASRRCVVNCTRAWGCGHITFASSGLGNKVVDISVLTSVMSLWIGHLCATRTSSSRSAVLKSPVNVSAVLKR
jgi:hypothetical protein